MKDIRPQNTYNVADNKNKIINNLNSFDYEKSVMPRREFNLPSLNRTPQNKHQISMLNIKVIHIICWSR